MASLSAHLRRTDDHERLPFHAQCPHCREQRLAGTLPVEPLVSRRTQAAITAGVLALTSVAPTAAFAREDEQEFEGGTASEQVVPESDGDFDPGGDTGGGWEDGGTAPADAGVDSGHAPAAAPDARAVAPVRESASIAPSGGIVTAPADPAAPPAGAPVFAAADGDPSAPALPPAVTGTLRSDSAERAATRRAASEERQRRHAERWAEARRAASAPAPVPHALPVAVARPAAPAVVQGGPVPVAAVEPITGRAARPGDRIHTVLRGESLWTIAADLLGDDASPARIAREVNRLWERNQDRIGTGDRDLLIPGTALELK